VCVLICRVSERPLLAANRDEIYARPFSAPRVWAAGVPFWAPRDEEQGGTWIGVNRNGLVAAITNRSRLPQVPGRASRGHLVSGLLARPDAESARAWLQAELALVPRNPCQLFWMQGRAAWLALVGEKGFSVEPLQPGLHVLSNLHDPDEIDFGLDPGTGWEELRPILRDRSPRLPRGFAVCKDAGWRGTVASALIEPGRRFLFSDGPPDKCDYRSVPGYPSAASGGGV